MLNCSIAFCPCGNEASCVFLNVALVKLLFKPFEARQQAKFLLMWKATSMLNATRCLSLNWLKHILPAQQRDMLRVTKKLSQWNTAFTKLDTLVGEFMNGTGYTSFLHHLY